MKRALVTGGCGFLGSSIVRALLGRNVDVRVLLLPGEPTDNVDGLDVELVTGNVLDRDAVVQAVQGVDSVFHAAAVYQAWCPDPTHMYRVNLSGTFNVLEAARREGVARVVYTASIVSLGRPLPGQLASEDTAYDAWDLDFAYSRSKYLSRQLVEDFVRWGLDVRVVCPGVILGPGDVAPTPSGKLIINTLQTPTPFYTESGMNYVDVRDAAEVHVLAAERGSAGERYLATGHNSSTKQLMEAICRAAGKSKRFFPIPVPVARAAVRAFEAHARRTGTEPPVTREFFEYSLKHGYYDNAKSKRELGASVRPLSETLRDAITYFRGRGLI
ncbi:MAG: SDR family oxidoreductase [Polyangiaceae bacterium]